MKLDENYSITGESNNWVLEKHEDTGEVNEKTGEPIISRDKWYSSRIEEALKRYVSEVSKIPQDVKQLIQKLDDVYEVIEGIKC